MVKSQGLFAAVPSEYTCISLARGVISTANCARKMSEGTATSAPAPPTPFSLPFSQSRRLLLLLFSYSSSFFSMQLTFSIHRHPTAAESSHNSIIWRRKTPLHRHHHQKVLPLVAHSRNKNQTGSIERKEHGL